MALFLVWTATVMALWIAARSVLIDASEEEEAERQSAAAVGAVLAAGPPTFVLALTAFVLFQAAPTAQFNADSPGAMRMWSFWVDIFIPLLWFMLLQILGYFCWLVGMLFCRVRPSIGIAVALALLASILGLFLIGSAAPTA